MRTVDAFAEDIARQSGYLKRFQAGRIIQKSKQDKTIFTGSGDSLAAAMLASAFSDYAIRVVDPLDLAKNPKIAQGRHVYFVSVSGNTKANVDAARLLKNTTAITKNPHSRLGANCNDVITLSYEDWGVLTSGSIGFVASALECISKAVSFDIRNADKILERAKLEAGRVRLKGKVFFVGGQHTYPVAMYAAAKMYEVVGLDAHYEKTEQFFHMGLFCTKDGDTVISFGKLPSRRALEKLGLGVYTPRAGTQDKVEQVLFYTFFSQFLALNLARKKGQKECHFVLQKRIRAASSQTIY